MILSSMSKLHIFDKPLLFTLFSLIKQNLKELTARSMCIFLVHLQKLGMIHKRVTYEIYKSVRGREKELNDADDETLLNLAGCVSQLCFRKLSKND